MIDQLNIQSNLNKFSFIALCLFIFNQWIYGQSKTIYVDPQLSANCTSNYSIQNRNCSGSDGDAYPSLQAAADVATAGTLVIIRGGTYNSNLVVKHSGNEEAYVTFRNFENEVPEITGETIYPAINIKNKNYIIIEGLKIKEVRRWVSILGSNYIILKNNIFDTALDPYGSSKTGIFLQSSNHCKILDNVINQTTQDNIGLVSSNYNLIEGNTITRGRHVLWTMKCSNYNIIRNNYFHNALQKIGEIYDCDNVGDGSTEFPKITSLDNAKYNLVERNIFAYTPSPGDASPYSGIQYSGQNGIIRNNLFYECEGPAIQMTIYGTEATYNYSNRIAHNVFYKNEYGAIEITSSSTSNFHDQQIRNNIFYKNKFIQRDMRWRWFEELNEKPVQIMTGRTSGMSFKNNVIFSSELNELYVIAYGSRTSSTNPAPQSLAYWEYMFPDLFSGNLQVNPLFVNEDEKDFRLKEGSPMIDAGMFLTHTTNQGVNSQEIIVKDAGWFTDGFGIIGGDTIQLEGQTEYAIISSINYNTGTILIDRPLTWDVDQGVSMAYNGSAPDLGAFEYQIISSVNDRKIPEKNLIVYPNPSSGIITLNGEKVHQIKEVSLFCLLGNKIHTSFYDQNLDISHLFPGIYFVLVTYADGTTTNGKFVKY